MVSGFFSSRKILVGLFLGLICVVLFWYATTPEAGIPTFTQLAAIAKSPECPPCPALHCPLPGEAPGPPMKDVIENSGGNEYLRQYEKLFADPKKPPAVKANPNKPETITQWWQAAAMIDWYINGPPRYRCQKRVPMGNWHVCQDEPYTIKPPCLVYSFGINFDFSFDDAMVKLGCEVYSFDPSMKLEDHKRGNNSMFYNMGLGSYNSDAFSPRSDMYVTERQAWKIRTLKSVIKMLGHENRVIDVLKIDVESYEWDVLDNMMETDVFQFVRQFMLEYHLFPDYPLFEDYVYKYQIYTRFREMGFREYAVGPHPKTLKVDKFNNQGDSEYVNIFFERKAHWR